MNVLHAAALGLCRLPLDGGRNRVDYQAGYTTAPLNHTLSAGGLISFLSCLKTKREKKKRKKTRDFLGKLWKLIMAPERAYGSAGRGGADAKQWGAPGAEPRLAFTHPNPLPEHPRHHRTCSSSLLPPDQTPLPSVAGVGRCAHFGGAGAQG